jgi:hypothetical protein
MKRDASFLVEGLFIWVRHINFVWRLSQWARHLIARLHSWLCCSAQKHLSNIELTLLTILTLLPHTLGNEAFIAAFGYMGSASLNTSHLCRFPLWGKEYMSQKVNMWHYALRWRLVYNSRHLCFLQVVLNVQTMKVVCIPGMLQHLALGI